jgi:hypothetical protein
MNRIIIALVLVLVIAVSLNSCSAGSVSSGGNQVSSKPSLKLKLKLVPAVGFNNELKSRAVVPATMTTEDINYFVYCPALTGFIESTNELTDGQALTSQPFLDTAVSFTPNSFTGGVNGISSGTRFSGVLVDGSGSIVVEIDGCVNLIVAEKVLNNIRYME